MLCALWGCESMGVSAHGCGGEPPGRTPPPPEMAVEEVEAARASAEETRAERRDDDGEETRAPVIDVHTHIGRNAYEVAMRLADENGVQRMVNLSGGNQWRRKGLKPHLKALKAYPGRLAVFYNVPWGAFSEPDFGDEVADGLEEAVKAGYAGLKIPKALGLGVTTKDNEFVAVDDPRLDPIWARAGELGVPVSIHTGDPKAFFEPMTPDNERIDELSLRPGWSFADSSFPRREVLLAQRDRMLARHRKTTFILVHFGNNPEDLDYLEALLARHPNVVLDVAARLGEIGRHDPTRVRRFFKAHQARILFGTDIGVHRKVYKGQRFYSLFLGSISKEPPTLASVGVFFERHWQFFELDAAQTPDIPHPIAIQGPWPIHPIGLEAETLRAIYHDNAYRLIFAPMFKRQGVKDPLLASD